ncbi:MAG TPA: hypothetical protein VFX17_02325 [Patescibacteria group bacterium]|nr:hypothetical protein [Patescibacteria group bacterium]
MKINLKYIAFAFIAGIIVTASIFSIYKIYRNGEQPSVRVSAFKNSSNEPFVSDSSSQSSIFTGGQDLTPAVVPAETPVPAPIDPPITPSPNPTPIPAPTPLPTPTPTPVPPPSPKYPLHTNITATVFWVGEPVGNGSSEDNSISAYDDLWEHDYGGFDDYSYLRTAANNYFPTNITPKQNPFYLDLPFDDINNKTAYTWRSNIPWYTGNTSKGFSDMKNRWVKIQKGSAICYGQIEDAGPYVYNDSNYVFGSSDARPASQKASNAGMDVSPALRDCLGFDGLNNDENKVDWQFVDDADVPNGPWKILVTTQQVNQP